MRCLALVFAALVSEAAQSPPPHLQALVEAERAFASAARTSGWRAAFLAFFVEDTVTFAPGPAFVKPQLRRRRIGHRRTRS